MPPETNKKKHDLTCYLPRRTMWTPVSSDGVSRASSLVSAGERKRKCEHVQRQSQRVASPKGPRIKMDRLGKKVIKNVKLFNSVNCDWPRYASKVRTRSHIHPQVESIQHPAAAFLAALRDYGAPVFMDDDAWDVDLLRARAHRGPHQSTKAYADFVRDEMADFDDKSFWTVLPLEILLTHVKNLRLSPLGCVPQRDRRPRLINDLTFYGINDHTIRLAPLTAMQFGHALDRILQRIRDADPRHGPVYMAKVDIADGFYRIDVAAEMAPILAVILPFSEGEDPLVAIPLALPMGWTESPPLFCALTETVADMANARTHQAARPH